MRKKSSVSVVLFLLAALCGVGGSACLALSLLLLVEGLFRPGGDGGSHGWTVALAATGIACFAAVWGISRLDRLMNAAPRAPEGFDVLPPPPPG